MARGGKRRGAGAPAGNVNAVRHGLYSHRLTDPQQLHLLLDALAMDPSLDEEIALLRVQIAKHVDDGDLDVLGPAILTLFKALTVNERVSRRSYDDFFEATVGVLEGIGSSLGLNLVDWP